jgi:hypothetical protein
MHALASVQNVVNNKMKVVVLGGSVEAGIYVKLINVASMVSSVH